MDGDRQLLVRDFFSVGQAPQRLNEDATVVATKVAGTYEIVEEGVSTIVPLVHVGHSTLPSWS
jgi:hypothetical protein